MTTCGLALILFTVLYWLCTSSKVLTINLTGPIIPTSRQKKWADSALTLQPSDQHKRKVCR